MINTVVEKTDRSICFAGKLQVMMHKKSREYGKYAKYAKYGEACKVAKGIPIKTEPRRKGFGKVKAEKYGSAIIAILKECE